MKTIRSLVAASALLAVATPALADDASPDVKARAAKRVDEAFAKLDTDHDGKISKIEGAKGPKISKGFDRIDADHDGFITRAELTAAIERRMARAAAKQQQKQPAPAPTPAPQQ